VALPRAPVVLEWCEGSSAAVQDDARCGGGEGPSATKKCSEVMNTGASVSMVGICEGCTCTVEHHAPHEVMSGQDGGRGRSAEKLAIAAMVHVSLHWRASRTWRIRRFGEESKACAPFCRSEA
jgi:hypothetical protein